MRWKLSLQAKADLRRIGHRIARDNPETAVAWVQKLQDRASRAGQAPWQGRKVPEIDGNDIREAIVGNYRIVYIVQDRIVQILTIFEGHRLLPDLDLP